MSNSELNPAIDQTNFAELAVLAAELQRDDNNTLELPAIDQNIIPIVSAVLAAPGEPRIQRTVRHGNGEIDLTESYPDLIAFAAYLGMWPHDRRGSSTAGLYTIEVPFTPDPLLYQLPLRATLEALKYREKEATTPEGDIVYTNGSRYKLSGVAGTELRIDEFGKNTLTGARHVKAHLSGPVRVDLSAGHLGKITNEGIFSPTDKEVVVEIQADTHQRMPGSSGYDKYVRDLPLGHKLTLNDEGKVIQIDEHGDTVNDTSTYDAKPCLPDLNPILMNGLSALMPHLDLITWEDSTASLFTQWKLFEYAEQKGALTFDPEAFVASMIRNAHDLILAKIKQNNINPITHPGAIKSELEDIRNRAIFVSSARRMNKYWFMERRK